MIDTSNMSKLEIVKQLPQAQRIKFFASLSREAALALQHDITFIGRPKQQLPDGEWDYLLALAGRGFGGGPLFAH